MAWVILLVSAVFEAVWATAMGMSDGFTRPLPTVVFFVTLVISMAGLGWAVQTIPIGTGYAVWTGVGAAVTVTYAMATGTEPVSLVRIVLISGIILAVIGLKLVPASAERRRDRAAPPPSPTGPGRAARSSQSRSVTGTG